MQPRTVNSGSVEVHSVPSRNEIWDEYRRLLGSLAARAHRLGSRDPDGAAQETLARSWGNATSQPALKYYFGWDLPTETAEPAWSLEHLLAWLHAVLRYVVSEERNRVAYRLEVSLDDDDRSWSETRLSEPSDTSADQLQQLMRREFESILGECFPKLDSRYRSVLRMRGTGMKYDEIASRLREKENTIATWMSRGIRDLARCVGRRTRRVRNNK